MGMVGESLIPMGRELYRDGATNSNILPPYLLVRVCGVTRSSVKGPQRSCGGVGSQEVRYVLWSKPIESFIGYCEDLIHDPFWNGQPMESGEDRSNTVKLPSPRGQLGSTILGHLESI